MAGQDEVLVQGDSGQRSSHHLTDSTSEALRHGIYNENGHRVSAGQGDTMRQDTSSRHLPDILIGNGDASSSGKESPWKSEEKIAGMIESGGLKELLFRHQDPSKQDICDAQKKLDNQIDELLPDDRKQNLKGLQDAALSGDPKAMSDAISKINPQDLPAYIKELNKNLDATNAGLQAQVDKAGNVVMYGDKGNKAIEIGPNGQTTVRAIEREPDGTVVMKDGEVLGADPNKVMKHLSNNAVDNINDPLGGIIKEQPPRIWPELPPDFPKDFPKDFPRDPGYNPGWPGDPGIMPEKPRWEDPGFAPRKREDWKGIELLLNSNGLTLDNTSRSNRDQQY